MAIAFPTFCASFCTSETCRLAVDQPCAVLFPYVLVAWSVAKVLARFGSPGDGCAISSPLLGLSAYRKARRSALRRRGPRFVNPVLVPRSMPNSDLNR
jgi:hypothetical protein